MLKDEKLPTMLVIKVERSFLSWNKMCCKKKSTTNCDLYSRILAFINGENGFYDMRTSA